MKGYGTTRLVLWSVLLFVFWIAIYEKILIIEVIVSLLVIFFTLFLAQKLIPEAKKESDIDNAKLRSIKQYFVYLLYILRDIAIANFHVAKVILSPRMRIKPEMLYYEHGFKKNLTRFMYANSITLTPGTLTIEMDDDNVAVHLLDMKSEAGLINWKVEKLLSKLERSL